MMWWSYDVVASQCSQSYLCGLWSLSLIIITFIFICYSLGLQFCLWGLSVLRVLCCGGLRVLWCGGLLMWWSYLCGGVVLLIIGLNNSCGVLWEQCFWVLCGRGGNGVAGIRK